MRSVSKFLIASLLLPISISAHAKYTVCTLTINSKQEREVFKSRLNPQDFDFVELTDYADPKNPEQSGWFTRACEAKVQCDVLVISGHFGGSFFGETKMSLSLKELEKQSCDQKCTGVLGNLKESYLMGCNTLAGKSRDGRTPEQYRAVLVRDGIEPTEAERIVASRYGPFGSSFGDRMERIFENAKVIYGYSSVGPSGANVKQSLSTLLNKFGDYKTHLDQLDVFKARQQWSDSMKAYNRASSVGLTKSNAAYVIKENLCRLNDDNRSKIDRLRLAQELLDQNALLYIPTVAGFLNSEIPPDGFRPGRYLDKAGLNLLDQMRRRSDLARTFALARESEGVTPTIKMDLLKAERNVGWITSWVYANEVRGLFATFTKDVDVAGSDFICSQISEDRELRRFINVDHVRNYPFNRPEHFQVARCIDAKDESVTARALDGYERNRAALTRGSIENTAKILYPIAELPGHNERRANVFRPYLNYKGAHQMDMARFVYPQLIATTKGTELHKIIQKTFVVLKKNKGFHSTIAFSLNRNSARDDEAIRLVLAEYFRSAPSDESLTGDFLINSPPLLNWLAELIQRSPIEKVLRMSTLLERVAKFDSAPLQTATIEALIRSADLPGQSETADSSAFESLSFAVSRLKLTVDQLNAIQTAYRSAPQTLAPHFRGLLYTRGRGVIDLDKTVLTELKHSRICADEEQKQCIYSWYSN